MLQVFSFEGCIRVRVLAGLLEVEGHMIKPSHAYTELFSLLVSGLVQLVSINPQETLDKELQEYGRR